MQFNLTRSTIQVDKLCALLREAGYDVPPNTHSMRIGIYDPATDMDGVDFPVPNDCHLVIKCVEGDDSQQANDIAGLVAMARKKADQNKDKRMAELPEGSKLIGHEDGTVRLHVPEGEADE